AGRSAHQGRQAGRAAEPCHPRRDAHGVLRLEGLARGHPARARRAPRDPVDVVRDRSDDAAVALAVREHQGRGPVLRPGLAAARWAMTALRVVVTGGSSGIGAEIARQYAARGARVAVFARRRDKLEQVAAECRALGAAEARVLEGDTTDAG